MAPSVHQARLMRGDAKNKQPLDRETHLKGIRLVCCSGTAKSFCLGPCSVRPETPSSTGSTGFCVIWVCICVAPGDTCF